MNTPLIELRNVTKSYPGVTEPAVLDLNLSVNAGELNMLL